MYLSKSPDFYPIFGRIGVFIAVFVIPKTMSNTKPKPMCNDIFRQFFDVDDGCGFFTGSAGRQVFKWRLIGR